MPFEKNANSYRREVAARLKRLAGFGPMVDGSLVVVRRRCGNPRCRCAQGEKHPAHYLMRKVGRKTISLYGSMGYPASIHAANPPRMGLTRAYPFCKRRNAARALVCSSRQVQ